MKKLLPGGAIGVSVGVVFVILQTVFRSAKTDAAFALGTYMFLFSVFFAAGFWYKKKGGTGGGIRIGAITGMVAFLTIFIFNLFANFFSDQHVNLTILQRIIWGIPLFTVFGIVFGGLGGLFAAFLAKKEIHKLPRMYYVLKVFFPFAVVVTLFTLSLYVISRYVLNRTNYFTGRDNTIEIQLLLGWIISLGIVFLFIVVWEILYRSEKNRTKP